MNLTRGCLRRTSLAVRVRGSRMEQVTFRLNGRTVRSMRVPRGQTTVDTTLRTSGGRTQRVTALVQFRSGRASRTLVATGFRCVQRNPTPQFTG